MLALCAAGRLAYRAQFSSGWSTPCPASIRCPSLHCQTTCAVTDAEFAELRQHFDADQVIEIVGVIALFGFLNRWNALLATDLEASPLSFAQRALGDIGWHPGSHAPDAA